MKILLKLHFLRNFYFIFYVSISWEPSVENIVFLHEIAARIPKRYIVNYDLIDDSKLWSSNDDRIYDISYMN